MAKKAEKQVSVKKLPEVSFYKKYFFQILIAGAAFLLFGNGLFNDYNMDDELVTRNHRLTSKGISAIPEIFTSPYYQDDMGYAYEYRPVPLSTFAIEHSLFGEKPLVSHFFNLLLYALLCLVLYRLLINIGGVISPVMALLITLLFCVHPAHTEVVSSIKNRDEILGLLFCLLSVNTALRAARQSSWFMILPAAGLFLLAMLCKSTLVPFAFFIPLALILFSRVSLLFSLALTALLALTAYGVLDINPAHYKLLFVVLLLGGVVVTHLLVRGTLGFSPADIRTFFTSPPTGAASANEPFSGLQPWLKSFNITSVYSLLPVIVVLLVYHFFCRNTAWSLLLVAGVLAASLLAHFKKYAFWSLNLGLLLGTILISMETIRLTGLIIPIQLKVQLYYTLLYLVAFWGKPAERLPAFFLVPVVTFYLGGGEQIGDMADTFMLFLFTRLTVGRNLLKAATAIILAVLAVILFAGISKNSLDNFDFSFLLKIVAVILMLNYKQSWLWVVKKVNTVLAVALVVLSVIMALQFPLSFYVTDAVNNNTDYLNIVETVVEKPIDRPLQFVEYPLPPGTTQDIKLGTSFLVLGHYLGKALWPYPLSFYYGYSYIKPTALSQPLPLFILTLHLLLLLAALYLLKKNPPIAFGLLIYLLSVIIYSGYLMPVPGIVADRYLLAPTAGYSIVVVMLLFYLFKVSDHAADINQLPKPLKLTLLTLGVLYSGLTFARNLDWKNDLTLMRKDVQYVHMSSQANNLLALHLMLQAELDPNPAQQTELRKEAITHFKKAIEIYPQFFNVAFDLGRAYTALNQLDSALVYFVRASQLDTTYHGSFQFASELLITMKRYDEAIPVTETFIRKLPKDYDGYSKLSYIYYMKGDYARSVAVNKQAVENLPGNINPLLNLARGFRAMQQPDSALFYFAQAQRMDPNNPVVQQAMREMGVIAKP